MYHDDRGLTLLAIIYSLPYAMLMWRSVAFCLFQFDWHDLTHVNVSTVSFLAAFSLMCLLHTDTMTVAWVGVTWLLVVLLILMCISMAWEGGEQFLQHFLWRKWTEFRGLMSIFKKKTERNVDSDNPRKSTGLMTIFKKTQKNADSRNPRKSIRQCGRWCFSRERSKIRTPLENNSIALC